MSRFQRLAVLAAALGLTMTVGGEVRAAPPAEASAAFQQGMTAYKAGDMTGAVKEWTGAADAGHVGAAWLLGNLYDAGKVVPQSDGLAFKYYKIAAEGGQPEAATRLGLIYREGNPEIELKKNYAEAVRWFEVGALAPRADAQFYLGQMHRNGWGVPVEKSEGLRWYLLSAKKRFAPAFLALARIHFDGDGVDVNREDAWGFLMLAQRYGDDEIKQKAEEAYEKYDPRMNAGEKRKGARFAEAWVESSTDGPGN